MLPASSKMGRYSRTTEPASGGLGMRVKAVPPLRHGVFRVVMGAEDQALAG